MRITSAQLYSYQLPLAMPLTLGSKSLSFRDGLLLKITIVNSHIGWGEIAPLEGRSTETLAEAKAQAFALLGRLRSLEIDVRNDGFADWSGSFLDPFQLYASVQFGVKSALLNALASTLGCFPARLLSPSHNDVVAVNGVITGSLDQVEAEAKRLRQSHFATVKLKVGRDTLEADVARLRTARDLLGSTIILRVDANQSWDLATAISFAQQVQECDIEYVEEPLTDPTLLPELCRRTGVRVALDESLMSRSPQSLSAFPGLYALVLKPTLLGGILRTLRFVSRARELQTMPVISASVETSVGLSMLANLAAAYGTPGIAHGLDTGKWLARDITPHPLEVKHGRISLDDTVLVMESVDLSSLTEITHV